MPRIIFILLSLFGSVSEKHYDFVKQQNVSAIRVLESESCNKWLKGIGTDSSKIQSVLKSSIYFDGKTSTVPLRYSGILNGMFRYDQPLNEWYKEYYLKPDLVQASLNDRLVVYVFNYKVLTEETIIHEALHFYFVKDDLALQARLGLRLNGVNTSNISKEIKKHCNAKGLAKTSPYVI